MSEPEEDFAAMFEASLKAKRFEKGQTHRGHDRRDRPRGGVRRRRRQGRGDDRARRAEGRRRRARGRRRRSHPGDGGVDAGGLTLSRKLVRGAATARQLEDAFRTGLPVEGKVERVVKGGYEVRIGRAARLLPDLADRHRPDRTRPRTSGRSTRSGSSNTRKAARTSSCRAARCSRRSSGRAPPRSGGRSSPAR